jgi:hypothetical protein
MEPMHNGALLLGVNVNLRSSVTVWRRPVLNQTSGRNVASRPTVLVTTWTFVVRACERAEASQLSQESRPLISPTPPEPQTWAYERLAPNPEL